MPSEEPEQTTVRRGGSAAPEPEQSIRPTPMGPGELAEWINRRLQWLSDRWTRHLRAREMGGGEAVPEELLAAFARTFISLLPELVGPYRSQVVPLWVRAAGLFGTAGATAGLAAGEVVDDFQLIREVLIRALYEQPPLGGRVPLSLREVLHLNRAIDQGVTQASIAHTDRLFFYLLEGSGTAEPELSEETVEEIRAELDAIDGELVSILGASRDGGRPDGLRS